MWTTLDLGKLGECIKMLRLPNKIAKKKKSDDQKKGEKKKIILKKRENKNRKRCITKYDSVVIFKMDVY